MSELSGTTISQYRIIGEVGRGGMGVVYKAEDLKLKRTVALKFLPPHLSASEQDKARFIQEAQAASALNHPNVCTIHDIQEHDGTMFIVMEYVDGETLQERKGSLTLKQALEIGIQIADGLAAAHEKGIIHRDIKPENIMIRKDGIPQIMDFGLAKLGVSRATRLTKEGSTVGTAGYMSPEQVQGHDTDHRSDIFSFGVLLYEMFTGQLPFRGVHETALLYEIVNVDAPPMSSIKPDIDPGIDAIVLDCLEKDPKERCQSMAEVARELRKVKRESTRQRISRVSAAAPLQVTAETGRNGKGELLQVSGSRSEANHGIIWRWGAVLFFITTLASIVYYNFAVAPQIKQTIRASLLLPARSNLNNQRGGGHIALSPDGQKLAFAVVDSSGNTSLWVRSLNATSAQMLAGTDGAQFPFWSPDGKVLAFFADDKLKKIDPAGGTPFTICDAQDPRGGSWSPAGVMIFESGTTGAMKQVSSAGGIPTPATKLDSTRNEITHRWPWFLPDGKHFLFFSRTTAAGSGSGGDSICVGSTDSPEITRLIQGESDALFAQGYILFMHESALMAQQFDLKKLNVVGEAVPIIQQIQYDARFSKAVVSVSQNGLLVYQATGTRWTRELALFDTSGKKIMSFGQPEVFNRARLSGDGKMISMEIIDLQSHNFDIWLYDITRGIQTRFTFDPAQDIAPFWSPSGDRIVFSSDRKGHADLYMKATAGSSLEELLTDFGSSDKFVTDWSPDGKYLLFAMLKGPTTKNDLWLLPMEGDRKPVPFQASEFNETNGVFSPNMNWIAYVSDESGRTEVYVRPFIRPGSQKSPSSLGKWQVSVNGGNFPRWKSDGTAIYYVAGDGIMKADIRESGPSFEVLKVNHYATFPSKDNGFFKDMTSNGMTILGQVTQAQGNSMPLTLVTNWDAELKKK